MKADHIYNYNSSEYQNFVELYRNNGAQNQIIIFAGEFDEDRNFAINDLKSSTRGKVEEINLGNVIDLSENKSYENTDKMVKNIGDDTGLVIFRNADVLNGAYTGFTNSAVKYGTPQEKYFLKKIRQVDAALLIELKSTDSLDRRIVNEADQIVLFTVPSTFLDKVFWKLKNMRVHGSRFNTPRKA